MKIDEITSLLTFSKYLAGTAVVLYATYLYSAPERKPLSLPAQIPVLDVKREERGYYDRSPTIATTPLIYEKGTVTAPITPASGKFKENGDWRPNADEKREA